ncbi:sigma-E factor negative regulatory protein [Simplicispira metamorpha]|jgi:sigma-E factor negative regulatory protein RseA|uniref:RseA-like anti sigma(E) protein n=1 Tax=Simplicispira metamorpha TaxID=80881 RepID=A0A4R2NA84_9BURK|nr:RseA family anti-sigma factor [Simplicispira metamorpha]TCP17989.1 RseA-like anti sigma(E) protein [Simplicispira metamorpha]
MADATGVGSTGEIMMENLNQKEMLSALADGQLSGNALTQALEFSSQDEGRETWQLYQLVGDVLRSPELARPVDNGDFLARLRTQLAQEAAPVAQATASSPTAPAQPVLTQFTPPPQAANDSVFRWKMVAGLASLAAVATLVWSAVGGLGGPPAGAQMAAVSAPVTASVSVQAPAVSLADNQAPQQVMIRDPRLDELLAAHKQFGGTSALQLPAGFLRNANFEAPKR